MGKWDGSSYTNDKGDSKGHVAVEHNAPSNSGYNGTYAGSVDGHTTGHFSTLDAAKESVEKAAGK